MQYTTRGQIKGTVQVYDCAPHNENLYVVNFGAVHLMSDHPEQLLETLRNAVNQLTALLSDRDNE
jgi:hypothetical protein